MTDAFTHALSRVDLPTGTRHQLHNVQAVLDRDPQAHLESFSLVGERAYAVISFGDVSTADLVVFVLHGIDTDLSALPSWADAAQRICADVLRACVARGTPRSVATIAWFGWDSGTHVTARSTTHATIGAARLAVDIDRVRERNPAAHIAVVTYSYSTTLLGEMLALGMSGQVHTAFSIASAGVTHAARVAIADAISRGDLVLYATEGADDGIAPLGRLGQHPVDPRDIPGVIVYECDGGPAPAVDGGTVPGLPVEGHASQSTVDEHGVRHIGYFDERAQGYLTLVGALADAAASAR
ncbi:alpha/beta hydrolase [Microbacterium sp. XT11]|uniref:alpha/beta hydrolase n=1 Tax=Microbacterium sp. XT11 TaxID=367477 RepID=UPI000833163F|nr:alpha/beta hydrolase [Microbacterium sp. XT11]